MVPVTAWAFSSRHLHQSLKSLDNLNNPSSAVVGGGSKEDPSSSATRSSDCLLPHSVRITPKHPWLVQRSCWYSRIPFQFVRGCCLALLLLHIYIYIYICWIKRYKNKNKKQRNIVQGKYTYRPAWRNSLPWKVLQRLQNTTSRSGKALRNGCRRERISISPPPNWVPPSV